MRYMIAAVALCLSCQPAFAQMMCGPRAEIVAQLTGKFGETRRVSGLASGGAVVEVYASEASGSWTILLTNAQGVSCLMAAGEAWQDEPASVPGNPA